MNAISVDKPLERAPGAWQRRTDAQQETAVRLFSRVHLGILSALVVVQLLWMALLGYGALLLLH